MGKNVTMSVLLMVALVMVATMAPPTMGIRGKVPLLLALRQRGIQVTKTEEAKIEQQLANIMLEAVAESEHNNNNVLRCIPQYNRCGPAMDGVHCCPPYTCTSQYYGNCS